MELVPDRPDDPRARTATRTATRTTGGRQRVLAAMVVAAAGLLVYSLSGGPWARAEIGGGGPSGDAAVTQLELRLSGDVDVEPGDGPVADDLDGPGAARSALAASIGGATRDLTQVLGVLIVVVSAVGVALELRSRLWGLLASASLVCLLAATVLRDMATSALATGATAADAGPFAVDPTGWSGLAIGAAAVAALASFLATAERGVAGPIRRRCSGPTRPTSPTSPTSSTPRRPPGAGGPRRDGSAGACSTRCRHASVEPVTAAARAATELHVVVEVAVEVHVDGPGSPGVALRPGLPRRPPRGRPAGESTTGAGRRRAGIWA